MREPQAKLWSIRWQVVGLGVALTVPLLALFAWFAWWEYRSERDRQSESLLYLARALSSSVDRELASARTLLETLATSRVLREGRLKDYHQQMKEAAAIKPGSWIVLWAPSGKMLANTLVPWGAPLPNIFSLQIPEPAPEELSKGNPWSLRQALETGRPAYSNLFLGLIGGRPMVTIDVPVLREGKVVNVLSLSLPADSFQAIIAEQKFGREVGVGITDRRHFAIARAVAPERYVGKRVTRPLREAIDRTPEEWGEGRNHEGEVVLHAFTTSPVSGWVSAVSITESAAIAPIWRSMLAWGGGFGALALVLAFIAWWLGRRVVGPLRMLAEQAKRMDIRGLALPEVRTRELAELSAALAAGLAVMREGEEARVQWAEAEARSREAVQANAAKDEFLALLSHELRNPLAAIALSAETLARGADPARTARALASLSRHVGHLRELVDDLLDLAAATHGKLAVHPRPVDLLQAACAAAEAARERHPGVAFEPSGDPVRVGADPVRLEQMIGNLLDNAAKAQASVVHIRVSADRSWGMLDVTDNGEGITPHVMPRLFEAFYQGERQGQARPRGGLGVGLTLVNRLALAHGGALGAQSEGAGHGSTFSLRLPLATSAEVRPPRSAPTGKLRIVIVEDEQDVREGLRSVLETEGHAVAAATDGVEGLALLLAFAPDAALIDIGLPRMDGLEVARRARAAGSNAFLIAISGYAAQRDRHGTAVAGFDLHLAKPVTGEDLKLALTRSAAKAA